MGYIQKDDFREKKMDGNWKALPSGPIPTVLNYVAIRSGSVAT